MMKRIFNILLFIIAFSNANAQPYAEDIAAFRKKDSAAFPKANQILFIGSSSFTKWTDVQDYFPKHKILNRAFGGSTLADVIYWSNDVVFKYKPKQIVIYCGENDFAYSDTIQIPTVVNRFKTLFTMIRKHYKNIPVVYVSMKPSPSRKHLISKYIVANMNISSYLSRYKNTKFIDVYHAMLKPNGSPLDDIYVEDNLHMNAKGYAIWQKLIGPYLLK